MITTRMVKDDEFYRWKLLKLISKEEFGGWAGVGKIQGRIIKKHTRRIRCYS